LRSLASVGIGIALSTGCAAPADLRPRDVVLHVRFALTDLDYHPVASAPVRLVFGSDANWQRQLSGDRFITDTKGEHRFTARVSLDKRPRKLPTNFVGSLLSRPQMTDHLMVGAELEYMTFQWLYTVDIYRFPGGDDVLMDGEAVYTRDSHGDFTRKASHEGHDWRIADLGNLLVTSPGHQAWNSMLQPDPADASGAQWTLEIAFKRSPPPVRR
jgi:hypothetical protein